MASFSRLERLQLAARRLREIRAETAAIYRRFPDLERQTPSGRGHRPAAAGARDRTAMSSAGLR